MTTTDERRRYRRCTAWLPLQLKAVGGKLEPEPLTLITQNFSKTGLCFPSPRRIEPGESIDVEVTILGAGPDGKNINISSTGYVVRVETATKPGWYKLAAVFEEPHSDEEPGWQKLSAAFDGPSHP